MAERVGFEPPVRFQVQPFSRPACLNRSHIPPLQWLCKGSVSPPKQHSGPLTIGVEKVWYSVAVQIRNHQRRIPRRTHESRDRPCLVKVALIDVPVAAFTGLAHLAPAFLL